MVDRNDRSRSLDKTTNDKKGIRDKDSKIVESLQTEINRLREEIGRLNQVTQSRTDTYVQEMICKIETLTNVVIDMKNKAENAYDQNPPPAYEPSSHAYCNCAKSQMVVSPCCCSRPVSPCSTAQQASCCCQEMKKSEETELQNEELKIKEENVSVQKTGETVKKDEEKFQENNNPSEKKRDDDGPALVECEPEKDELNYSAHKDPSYTKFVVENPPESLMKRDHYDDFDPSILSDNPSNLSILPEFYTAKETQTAGFYVNGDYPSSAGGSFRSSTCKSSCKIYTSCQITKKIKEILKNRSPDEVFLTILSWTTPMDYRVNVSDKKNGDILGSFDIKECTFQLAYREGVFDDYETQFIVHYFLRKQKRQCC